MGRERPQCFEKYALAGVYVPPVSYLGNLSRRVLRTDSNGQPLNLDSVASKLYEIYAEYLTLYRLPDAVEQSTKGVISSEPRYQRQKFIQDKDERKSSRYQGPGVCAAAATATM